MQSLLRRSGSHSKIAQKHSYCSPIGEQVMSPQ
jgi:hypothetical protein